MAVEVKRKQNESVEGLLRRFSKRMLQSRVVFRVKATRYHIKPKTKRQIKEAALRRKYIRAKREYLQKIGQLPNDDNPIGLSANYRPTKHQ
ncbi:30S ribosomal protein S21 [Candidatus Kuenenbacteria bacterium CG11_big_fil_rev_8_21_14_0_20_37_9]|uniref:Small ribosomal subunit protein bS21 n=2 Tax=Candidatus Kueneniibacteriota TaxID=1752740 RepID=A0A2M6XTN5_9BACT|nr:MAG: 30S ribosomal protein S21 [Candidatus Kuenenbacteria bacterium CG1_02_38_13]PIR05914.1 MAG: 30S ribosomal protein S21 [Candidatus Kuenenbacteria bacterium CG11_big_fil_rev_8_21_14_0_20_37_9]PIU10990.1 MAG: 30S ribosomal protein S21 [Candidatus Kuenenbacteria bacterium CG08_land_8_20_14_0_20_37_23]